MKCITFDKLAAFVDGLLLQEEEKQINEHIEFCPACLEVVKALRTEDAFLEEAIHSPFLPDDFDEKVLSKLEPYQPKKRKRNWVYPVITAASLLLALSLFAAFYTAFKDGPPKSTDQTPIEENNDNPIDETEEITEEEDLEPPAPLPEEEEEEPEEESSETTLLTDEEISETIIRLTESIKQTFFDLGQQYRWTNQKNPPDYSILRAELEPYATTSFLDGELKRVSELAYCECDIKLFPEPDFDIRMQIEEKTENRITVSSVYLENMLHIGSTSIFTIVKEDGKWVFDHWESVATEDRKMDLTASELEIAYNWNDNGSEIINTVEDNGRKLYILYTPNDSEGTKVRGVYADNSRITFDMKESWIPQVYSEDPSFKVEGMWTEETANHELQITNSTKEGFQFSINTESDGIPVEMNGEAHYIKEEVALFYDNNSCRIAFTITETGIEVDETYACSSYHGSVHFFEGIYGRVEEE